MYNDLRQRPTNSYSQFLLLGSKIFGQAAGFIYNEKVERQIANI